MSVSLWRHPFGFLTGPRPGSSQLYDTTRRTPRRIGSSLLILALGAVATTALRGQVAITGEAPRAPEVHLLPHVVSRLTTSNWYDTSNREAIRTAWLTTFVPTISVPTGWTGDIATNNAGTTTQAFKDAVATRINWFRAMAGVPTGITLDSVFSGKDQLAALMFSANKAISHNPPTTWIDYSADGAQAAANSNICYAFNYVDPGCVLLYMIDSGAGNPDVGHRRWLLYPQTQTMGTGDVPQNGPALNPFPMANAIWVLDGRFGTTRPPTRDNYVAWPPPGFSPYQVVGPRWSFSYPAADFSHATVAMHRNGASVPVRLETVANGFGENTIVWVPDNLDANAFFQPTPPASDTTSSVTISNVIIGGVPQSFSYSVTVFDPAVSSTAGLQFIPVTPCRIMDTRGPTGTFGGPFISGQSTRSIPIPSSNCGIPATAIAYSLNATVVPRTGTLGFLTLFPTGTQPTVSTLNSPDGSVLANAAIVPAGSGGSINAFALQDTDLVLDINGYFVPPGAATLQFYPLPPCRVLDTRGAAGTFGGPALTGGVARSFPIRSSACGVPATAQAYSFNVTVVPHGLLGFLTVWPTGQPQPNASTLNSLDGTILANAAIVPAGTGGAVSFYPMNTTDLVVDINGYFAAPGAGGHNFYTVNPCRVLDTRNANGPLGGPIIAGNTTRTFPLPTSPCGLPSTAAAYSLNVTVQPSGPLGYLTVWPTGQTQPGVSTLNAGKGLVVANAAIVPTGTNGSINVYALDTTQVIIDANGYFGQ